MGTALTGSTVASTYTGLLKTTDSATLTSALKAISDGSGTDSALQVSTQAVNTSGDFSVATNKLTVASASGNTAVAGTLGVTGATTLSSTLGVTGASTLASVAVTGAATAASVATTGNISTSAGTISSYGAISQTQAGQNNSLAGNLSIGGNLSITGNTTLSGNLVAPGNLAVTGDFAVNTNKFNVTASSGNTLVAGTLGVTGTTSVSAINASGNASITGTLGVTGDTTLVNLSTTGNSTIGNAGTDTLVISSDNITVPNLSNVTVDLSNDKVLITDASDSSKVRTVSASSLGITASNAPQCVQQVSDDRYTYTGSVTAPGTEVATVTKSITPRSISSKILVSIVLNYSCITNSSQYVLFRVTRNGSEVGTSVGAGQKGIASGSYEDGDVNAINNTKIEFLDSPATSSAVTYKVHIFSPLSATNVYLNYAINGGTSFTTISTMTLQEYFA